MEDTLIRISLLNDLKISTVIEECSMDDLLEADNIYVYEDSTKKLMKILEKACPAFIRELRDRCNEYLDIIEQK